MHNLCFSEQDPNVSKEPFMAHLSDGTIVYEDKIPNIESTWVRLHKYLKDNDLKITKFSLTKEDSLFTISGDVDGYVFFKREGGIVGVSHEMWRAVGYVKDGVKYIIWKTPKGHKQETQEYQEGDPSVILCN